MLNIKFPLLKSPQKSSRGFTLIELVVVIAIISFILGIAVVNYQKTNQRARDGKRKADLEQIRAALEMYRVDNGKYPSAVPLPPTTSNCFSAPNWGCWSNKLNGTLGNYISGDMPQDPVFYDSGNACTSGDTTSRAYSYCTTDNGKTYILSTRLETSSALGTQTPGCCDGFANYKVYNP